MLLWVGIYPGNDPVFIRMFSCEAGWEGKMCTQALCTNGCGAGNECIAPEICRCGKLHTVIITKEKGKITKV